LEFYKLAEFAAPHLRPILWAAYETGMREGEILNLTWGGVSLKDRIIKLTTEATKDYEARVIPISDEFSEILNRMPRGIQDDYPVFTYAGKPIKDTRTGMTNACEKALITYGRFRDGGFIFHDLRRTFVTDMRRAGVQESVIMEITGHSRGEVFDRYNQVNMADMRYAIERMVDYRRVQLANVDQSVDQVAILGR
jgi:integrase